MLATKRRVSRERGFGTIIGEYPVSPEGFGAVEGLHASDSPAEAGTIVVVPRRQGSDRGAGAPSLRQGAQSHGRSVAGPYTLDQLQPKGNGDTFSSYGDFKKLAVLKQILKAYGTAGAGKEWHHIVEQGGDNATNFSPEQLHNTKNLLPLPDPIHDLVTAEYAKEYDTSGVSVREWLSGQSFEAQWNEGVKILRNLGILK